MVVGFQTSITTTTTSANAAVSTTAIKSAHIPTRLLHRSYIHLFTVSCGSKLYYPDKAMADADTVSIPMADSQASGSGSKQALISLSNKKDLAFLGNGLQELGFCDSSFWLILGGLYTIVSTGGTASSLQNAGVSVTKVEQLNGFPEMFDGRVKTLHPSIHGGILAQRDQKHHMEALSKHGIVSEKTLQENELSDAKFAWLCMKHVKSNAIVIAKENCMLGMGSGQPNHLESLRIALRKAGDEVKGAALASDAFFPFAEPGGSIREGDAVDCCNTYGVSLLFTNVRHFRH
ncbi:hypothetical protein RHGRI_010688 [Rhododendron griersonianum]|uniref:MGS-like domain-containing protein n=1 Tax=Rhododendron griersonianum TaxID=479676 RepID=A0AAV6KKJ8_9ERIC|nr:hypothetical protein RHGRI_010688 [Rhododendron griersonianum]